MGAYSRLRYVLAANVNALIEKAEDPEKLLRALIREMEDASEEAREACAELLAEEQSLARRHADLATQIDQWQQRAEQAVAANRDDLARASLQSRAELEQQRETIARERDSVASRKVQMEQDMHTLKTKLEEAKAKLKQSYTQGGASAPPAASLSRGERRMKQAMGRFERLQAQVENLEARVRSYEVGAAPAAAWEAAGEDPLVEEELQRLKERLGRSDKAGTATEPESTQEA